MKILNSFFIFALSISICAQSKPATDLNFDAGKFTIETAEVGGRTIRFRRYKNLVYVKNPVDAKYQSLNFYAPAEYVDFIRFVYCTKRMKTPPAFDGLDLKTGENDLFGDAETPAKHFTKFGAENSRASGAATADARIVKMMNSMNYVGAKSAKSAEHWRVRHGTIDKDTSLAIPIILATSLRNKDYDVDIELPWEQGHGGDYDLDELFSWVEKVCR